MDFLSSQGLCAGAAWRVCVPQLTVELLILMSVPLQTSRPVDWSVFIRSLGPGAAPSPLNFDPGSHRKNGGREGEASRKDSLPLSGTVWQVTEPRLRQ